MSFWDAIERHVADLDESGDAETPDPWAEVEVEAPGLTEEQVAHLAGLEDQPPVPRLKGDDAHGD
jgi:hypothetical protein